MDIIVKLSNRRLRFGISLGFCVIGKGIFVKAFSEINVGSLKVHFSFGSNEELILEVRWIEHFVQDDRELSVDSHFLWAMDQPADI